ncbi:uncharacterized protein LOC114354517 [Ostrinia furnacalis]|uniref:uncharacterized protein LOC114354517 n=1 Tax=Ostrinia furnacalis TaxID=93504 RepID=UPI0010408E68|nr:uncharacterized protein LOC114354517 [Ostrinia furnacalis]XP_028162747.1 uncharacterized protein LOC114354517 [Ostrinia furnacalis]
MGVVRGVPTDWTDDEVKTSISVPIGCGDILKVRRFKRKVTSNGKTEFVPTETVVLTFDGQVLPKRVFLCYNSLPVNLYIFPTIQCFNCCRYGHVKSQCRSTPRCFRCGQGHSGDRCTVEESVCCLCSGPHCATDRKCPEFDRQKGIKETMAKNCLSYGEALKLHPPITKSYASVLMSSPPPSPSIEYNSNLSNNSNRSYNKTVYLKPKAPPKHGKGYDRVAHSELVKDYNAPQPENGCALNNHDPNSLFNIPIKDLIIALITSLSKSNLVSLPSNVAIPNNSIQESNSQNGSKLSSVAVELPQH